MLLPFAEVIAIAAVVVGWIVLIAIAVDDLITMFEGGDSVIGFFLDQLFGVGASKSIVKSVKAAWVDLVAGIQNAITIVKMFSASVYEKVSAVVAFLSSVWGPPLAAAQAFFGALAGLAGQVAIFIGDTVGKALDGIVGMIEAVWTAVLSGAQRVAGALGIDLSALPGAAAALGGRALAAQGSAVAGVYSGATSMVQGAADSMRATNATTNVGQIVVNGAGNPEAVAASVQKRILAIQAAQIRAAAGALIPAAPDTGATR